MSNYKTYVDEDGDELEFAVFIIHGHSDDWKDVERFINKKLHFNTVVIKENYRAGETIIDKVEDAVREECDCAVAILSPDDLTTDGKRRARQNVLFELGYSQGVYKRENVVILKEKSVEINSDLHGIVYIEYASGDIKSTFSQLGEGLEEIYDGFAEDY